jgi:hypothetical protein
MYPLKSNHSRVAVELCTLCLSYPKIRLGNECCPEVTCLQAVDLYLFSHRMKWLIYYLRLEVLSIESLLLFSQLRNLDIGFLIGQA